MAQRRIYVLAHCHDDYLRWMERQSPQEETPEVRYKYLGSSSDLLSMHLLPDDMLIKLDDWYKGKDRNFLDLVWELQRRRDDLLKAVLR